MKPCVLVPIFCASIHTSAFLVWTCDSSHVRPYHIAWSASCWISSHGHAPPRQPVPTHGAHTLIRTPATHWMRQAHKPRPGSPPEEGHRGVEVVEEQVVEVAVAEVVVA